MNQPRSLEAHLETEEVVGYVAGTLSSSERDQVERHLADCVDCTAEIAAVARLRPRPRLPLRRLAPVAAAAAIVGIAVLGRGALGHHSVGSLERGGEAQAEVTVLLPANGAVLHEVPDLTWRPVPGATVYRVTVSRPNGDSVWAATTADTSVRGSDALRQAGPGLYYWYVDALLGDARSVAGSAHEFRIGP
jgi:hypothetical protein